MTSWAFLVLLLINQAIPSAYTDKMFRTAIDNHSTAPDYVLITVLDGNTGVSQQVCTTATFLVGAVHFETGLSFDEAEKSVLSNRGRVFVFYKPAALKNVQREYTNAQLNEVRLRLQSKTNQDLVKGFDLQRLRGELADAKSPDRSAYDAYRNAIAHVLLERGILCGQGCITDATYISNSN